MQEAELRGRLDGHELWLTSDEQQGARADLSGLDLRGRDLSGVNLRGAFLRGAQLDGAMLKDAELVHADFRDAQLRGADLSGANLLLADFTGADLSNAALSGTTTGGEEVLGHVRRGPRFRDANLSGADLSSAGCFKSDFSGATLAGTRFTGATLTGANLSDRDLKGLDFRSADLSSTNFQASDLTEADLTGATLVHADLQRSTLSKANIRGSNLQSANLGETKVDGIHYDRATRFRGVRVFSCYGSSRFRRFAQDQDFIEEFREAHPAYYRVWLVLTDCGRSMLRVVLWSLFFLVLFGWIYYLLGEEAFNTSAGGLGWSVFTTTYYSVVTFTTLGFGDITPNSPEAAVVVMLEVIVGYVMLGILISILATKVARRS